MSQRILTLLAPGFEEIETVTPVDLLRRAGAEVTLASLGEEPMVTGRNGITLRAETSLAALGQEAARFDLLFIPGGPGVAALRADPRVPNLARAYAQAGRPIAAICAAPAVLGDAGLLEGRRFTAHFSIAGEFPGAAMEERVVEEGHLITSRGAGTALDLGLALVRRLYGPEKAAEIAESIMASWSA